jgi:hypothetical protein
MIDEKRLETTPIQHIRNLIDSIKDGKLTVTYYDPIDPPYSRVYNVSCKAVDADEIISKYEALVQALVAIGAAHEKIETGAKAEDVLTPEQLEVWNTYIRDFDEKFDAGEYDLDIIYDMRECGAELNDEEHEVLERHYEWFEEQCLGRLPKKVYSPMLLINRAQRYEYLISYNAPKCVIDEEGRRLAEEMILYYAVR